MTDQTSTRARADLSDEEPSPNRPALEPGGCNCHVCGRIFIGAEWHLVCAICAPQDPEAQ